MRKADEPVIASLRSIKFEKKELEKKFIFEFEENDFFSNTTLTKTIYMKDEETPSHSVGT